jgi:hypothetical protein
MRELVQVFYEPGYVFDEVRERGHWVTAFLAVTLVGVLVYFGMVQLIGAGNLARQPFEANEKLAAMMPPGAIDKAAADAEKPSRQALGLASAAVGQAVSLLFLAGLFTGIVDIMNKKVRFWKMVGAVAYAWFPVAVVGGVLMLITIFFSSDRTHIDLQNVLATNASMFMSESTSKPLRAFVGTLDVLSFARIYLLSLGISKVAQTSFRQALGVVLALWAVWVLIRVGLSFIF